MTDTGIQSAPNTPSPGVDLVSETSVPNAPDVPQTPSASAIDDTPSLVENTASQSGRPPAREEPRPQNFQRAEDYIYYDRGLHNMKSRLSSGTITPEVHPSHVHLPKGVDLDSPVNVTYDVVELDFDLMATNTEYLRSREYLERFGPSSSFNLETLRLRLILELAFQEEHLKMLM